MLVKRCKRLLHEAIGYEEGGVLDFITSPEFEGLPKEEIYVKHKLPYPKFEIKEMLTLPNTIVIVSEALYKNKDIQLPRVNESHEYILAEFKLENDLASDRSDLAEYLNNVLDWYVKRGKVNTCGLRRYYPFIPVYMCGTFMICKFINNAGMSLFNFDNISKSNHYESILMNYMESIGYKTFKQQN